MVAASDVVRLQNRLAVLLGRPAAEFPEASDVDVVVSITEVNTRHGTGVLLLRLFGDRPGVVSVRSMDFFGGESYLGDRQLRLTQANKTRHAIYADTLAAMGGARVRRVCCVPFNPDDCWTAIALKDIFGASLCTYVMDDQNVCDSKIPDDLMRELLDKSDLRLTISPEMRDAYESKYRLKCWVLPPLVASGLVRTDPPEVPAEVLAGRLGVLVGNVWSQTWLDRLRVAVREAGIRVDWYGNAGGALRFDPAELAADGIRLYGHIPEAELATRLRSYAYAIMPSGDLDDTGCPHAIARLSLPTRVPFVLATSQTPIITLGSPLTAVARFVQRFELGEHAGYDGPSLGRAVDRVCASATQRRLRARAADLAPRFTSAAAGDWLLDSLAAGEPADNRYESLFDRRPGEFAYYVEAPPPKHICVDQIEAYAALRRLCRRGFRPDFVIDVGASTGVWSHTMAGLFPDARFLLVDPLFSHYRPEEVRGHLNGHPNFETAEAAASDRPGRARLNVSDNLYGSSLLSPADATFTKSVEVAVTTVDELARRHVLAGRGFLKVDVQCAEHLVLAGAAETLPRIDAVILELSLIRLDGRGKTFLEMLALMDSHGFDYYDDVGGWRSPVDGQCLQKDGLFVRKNLFGAD